jgi:hypothetical protein
MEQIKYDMSHTIFSLVNDNGKTNIKWNYNLLSKESLDSLRVIHKLYDENYFIWLNDNRKKLKPKNERTCRFCGKSYPEVNFSKKAHLFPESAGNKTHLSDLECDSCNYKFGLHENDFINFLGPFRAMSEIPKKGGFPKFKSRNKVMTIEQAYKNAIDLNLTNPDPKNKLSYDSKRNILRIQSEGDPYKPINVFKCLLKTAISMVDHSDLVDLSETINFLMDDNYKTNPSYDFILSMQQFFVPGTFNAPPFLIWYKRSAGHENVPIPSQIFIFYLRNLIFQIFIPFHAKDGLIYKATNERRLFIVPPLINVRWFEKYGGPFPRFINLNDSNITKENIQVIEYKFTENIS